MVGPDKCFEAYGHGQAKMDLKGMNGALGSREGANFIKFKDGSLIVYTIPTMQIEGLVMGKRVVNYVTDFEVRDINNNVMSLTKFGYNFNSF